jgi:translocation and assembly module TamB
MRRRLLLFFAAVVAGVAITIAALPYWLGAVAKRVGPGRGVTIGAYERLGYGRFAASDIHVRRAGVHVSVARIESDTPVLWWWRHRSRQETPIVATSWAVEVERNNTPSAPSPQRGWMQLQGLLHRIAAQLDRWLPAAKTGAGVVRFPGGEISVANATWHGRELVAQGLAYRAIKADARVRFDRDGKIKVVAHTPGDAPLPITTTLESEGSRVAGGFSLFEQAATLTANFGPAGWLPAAATLHAADWNIPAEKLKLGGSYVTVHGAAQVEWQAAGFAANVDLRGEPTPGKAAPPLEILLKGKGDLAAFTVEALQANLPGIAARLTEPVTVERSGALRAGAARFALELDLAKQPWFTGTGRVSGEARIESGIAAGPVVEFSLAGRDLDARDLKIQSIDARGQFAWPQLSITQAEIVGGAGERLSGHGGWNFRTREVLAAALNGEIRRASVARWLPPQPGFDSVKITAQAAGTLTELVHSGRAEAADVKVAGVNPLAVALEWRGAGASLENFTASAQVAKSRLTASGSVADATVNLATFEFTQDGTSRLKLAAPAAIRWRPQLEFESLRLAGPDASLTAGLTLGPAGQVKVSAAKISSEWLADLVPARGPAWQLTLLGLVGSWDRGPMDFSVTASASVQIGEGRTAAVMVSGRGDKSGIGIEALRATEADDTVVNAVGHLPVTFTPAQSPFMRIDVAGPVTLDATVAPNAAFWQKLADISGVALKDPQASAHVTGTWRRPEGNASLRAARIAIDPKRVRFALPNLDALDIQITGDRDGVTLNTFSMLVEGQAVRVQGRLPVPEGEWAAFVKEPLAMAQKGADLRLEIPQAEVAVFARFLPAVLAPKGSLQADVRYTRGGFEGYLKLRDAASRPLGPLGVLQEVTADVALSGRKLALRGVTARSGGQPVTLSGTVEFPEKGTPRFDLTMKGENLPFVRQTGLLLRGDLDLKLQSPENGPPRLSGSVHLRDSLFLSDVRAFIPKGGAGPTRRPPYFAIETPPVNTWTIAVDVSGEQFLRLRTPVFGGVASARFRLGGTLGEPRAIGEVMVNEGSVRMPFASFQVTQASVRLTEADPFEPAIYLRGTGRRYGYDLTMEIDGNASQPNVVFTSSPPIDSEQVLLMVMTGAAPTNDINRSTTQRMASIGYFLGSSLLGSLGNDATDPERLSIGSGEKISRQGKETYDIEYKLSDRWTLTGEYNEFDEYNAGVKWRVFRGKRAGENGDNAKK